ncbi:hypothetical protein Tco_0393052 [Tanacetum coccineum]
MGDDTQHQDEGYQFTYGLQYNVPSEQLALSPAVTEPDVLAGTTSKNAVARNVRRRLLASESIRRVNPSIDLTAERFGLSPVVTKTDPQVTPPSQKYLQNPNVPNLGSQNADARSVRRRLLITESIRPVNASIDVTGERSLKMPEIQPNYVADTEAPTDQNYPHVAASNFGSNSARPQDDTQAYMDLGDCDQQCLHYGCLFFYSERLRGASYARQAEYHLCCGRGKIYMPPDPDPPVFIKRLLKDANFLEHIRAYNQMFAMTSFGAKIDDSKRVTTRVFYNYIYDTQSEVSNRMHHFGGLDKGGLNLEIVQGLVHVLDEHNGLVRLFRTARDRCRAGDVPGFKIRLYNMGGVRGYELPISGVLGGIVFEDGLKSRIDFDVIIKFRGGPLLALKYADLYGIILDIWLMRTECIILDKGGLNPEIVQGLVHVLDEHNGLVRLFRTARDRCRAGDVPGFKIRLYNMGGVRGYELPISGVLGGIVFEDGLKSRIDFMSSLNSEAGLC